MLQGVAEDWRVTVIRTMARLVAIVTPVPVAVGAIAEPRRFLPLLVLYPFMAAGAAWAGWSRRAGLRARGVALALPLLTAGAYSEHLYGWAPGTVVTYANLTVLVGLVFGLRAGVASLAVTTACFAAIGIAWHQPPPGTPPAPPLAWARMTAMFAVGSGVLLTLVVVAIRRVEHSLADRERARDTLRTHDAQLHAALDAAQVATWSLDAATRRFEWSPEAAGILGVRLDELPGSMADLLARVAEVERSTVERAVEDTLSGRVDQHRLEYRMALPGHDPIRVEVRGRLVPAPPGSGARLTGTVADVTRRRREEDRRAAAQAVFLRLATSGLAAAGDLDGACAEITEAGSQFLDVERCGVWLLEDQGECLRCVDLYLRSAGTHERGTVLRARDYPAYFDALRGQRAVAAADARSDPRTSEFRDGYLVPLGIVSMLDSPIFLGGALSGVLCHEHVAAAPRPWSAEDDVVGGALADSASRALAAYQRTVAERAVRRAYTELGQVTRRLEAAREDERRRIAREVHDGLAQMLTAVKLNLGLIARASPGEAARQRLDETAKILDRAVDATRQLSRALAPPLLDQEGLVPALQVFLAEQARASSVAFDLDAGELPPRLGAEVESTAFRVVQEATSNALEHAEAAHVNVVLRAAGGRLSVIVRDDGRGFDPGEVATREPGRHLGLIGMRERARALDGTLEVTSAPGKGAEIRLDLPAA